MTGHKGRKAALVGAVLLVVLTFGVSFADAHSAEITIYDGTLVYQQIPGIDVNYNNVVTISLKTDSLGSYYEVEDPGSTGMFFPAECTPLDDAQDEIRCPATGISALYVRVGTGYSLTAAHPSTDSITVNAPVPATLSGGSVTNTGGPRTSDITVNSPVGGNVIYGNPGSGTLDTQNGVPDTIHSCLGNTVQADPSDTVIPDCAQPPDPPAPPPTFTPPPLSPGGSPVPTPTSPSTQTTQPTPTAQTAAIAVTYKQPQHILKRREVVLSLSLAMAMTVNVHATVALHVHRAVLRLKNAHVRVRAATPLTTVRLRVPRSKLKALRHALAKHRRLYASVQINASAPATGSSFALGRRVALIR